MPNGVPMGAPNIIPGMNAPNLFYQQVLSGLMQPQQSQGASWLPSYLMGATQQPTSNPFGGAVTGAATGFGLGGPVGAAIGGGLGLLSGIFSGIASGKKKKEAKQAFQTAQKDYQTQAAQLFPELAPSTFQYDNPAIRNAIQGALGYRLQNMFSDWGMPPGRQQGAGALNNIFAALMNNPYNPQQAADAAYSQGKKQPPAPSWGSTPWEAA